LPVVGVHEAPPPWPSKLRTLKVKVGRAQDDAVPASYRHRPGKPVRKAAIAIYIDVPVREDQLPEVFALLSQAPLDHGETLTEPDDDEDAADARDDARWDAYWSARDHVTEHLVERSDLIHAMLRAVAQSADDGTWVTTDDIAGEIGESPSTVASALGPLGWYLANRDLGSAVPLALPRRRIGSRCRWRRPRPPTSSSAPRRRVAQGAL
jgi:hypothetical protein